MDAIGLGRNADDDDVNAIKPRSPRSSIRLAKWCVILSAHVAFVS